MEMARHKTDSGQLVWGMFVMALGLLWTLDAIRVIEAREFWRYWPVFIVAAGVGRLMAPPLADGSRRGMFTVLFGLWLLGNTLELFFWKTSWPLLVIALGLSIVWKALAENDAARTRAARTGSQDTAGGERS
jgi:hypothetical protein